MLSMVSLECSYYDFIFKKKFRYDFDLSQDHLNDAFKFGEIVTKFCIQHLNYSLIGCGGSKSIITAQDVCNKKFDEYLSNGEGYWLHRMPKVYYVPVKNDIIGYFEELPVLPTNNLCYENDEYIYSNNTFLKVLSSRNFKRN